MKRLPSLLLVLMFVNIISFSHAAVQDGCHAQENYAALADEAFAAENYAQASIFYRCALALSNDQSQYRLQVSLLDSSILSGQYLNAYLPAYYLQRLYPTPELATFFEERLNFEVTPPDADSARLAGFTSLAINAGAFPNIMMGSDNAAEFYTRIAQTLPESGEQALFRAYSIIYDPAFPAGINALTNRGVDEGLIEEARLMLETAVGTSDDDSHLLGVIAKTYGLLGGERSQEFAKRGLELIDQAITFDPTIAELYFERARHRFRADRLPDTQEIERVVELEPAHYPALDTLAQISRNIVAQGNQQELDRFVEITQQMIDLIPYFFAPYQYRYQVFNFLGEVDKANTALFAYVQVVAAVGAGEIVEDPVEIGIESKLLMTRGRLFLMPLKVEAGDTIQIDIQAFPGDPVDPWLFVLTPDGDVLAQNDDTDSSYNSSLRIVFETAGVYTLAVTHAMGGSEGDVVVSVLRES